MEQKGQVATTQLLLLDFSLPLLTTLKRKEMLARAQSIAIKHRNRCSSLPLLLALSYAVIYPCRDMFCFTQCLYCL